MAEKQGYLHVLWESRKATFAPYLQFCEQCVPPGVQEGYPFLFPYLKIVRIVAGACVWMLPRQRYALSAGDYILFNNLEPRALTEVSGDAPLFLEQAIILPTSFPTVLLHTDFFYLCRDCMYSPVLHPDRAGYALVDESYRTLSAFCVRELGDESGDLFFQSGYAFAYRRDLALHRVGHMDLVEVLRLHLRAVLPHHLCRNADSGRVFGNVRQHHRARGDL